MKDNIFQGKCQLCGSAFAKKDMTRHLKACTEKKDTAETASKKRRTRQTGIFHLVVGGRFQPAYWLHLNIRSDSTLRDLDHFLRATWLECCGHMSAFRIAERTYLSQLFQESSFGWGPERQEYKMDVKLGKVLRPGMKFFHEYDFGTPTELSLKVFSYREGHMEERIRLMARNEPPPILCERCGAKADLVCVECIWAKGAWLCKKCAKSHEHDDMLLPVVNSPRVGQCGYTGS